MQCWHRRKNEGGSFKYRPCQQLSTSTRSTFIRRSARNVKLSKNELQNRLMHRKVHVSTSPYSKLSKKTRRFRPFAWDIPEKSRPKNRRRKFTANQTLAGSTIFYELSIRRRRKDQKRNLRQMRTQSIKYHLPMQNQHDAPPRNYSMARKCSSHARKMQFAPFFQRPKTGGAKWLKRFLQTFVKTCLVKNR